LNPADAVAAGPGEVAARYARHVNPAFIQLLGTLGYGRVFVRARDVFVWDSRGRRYLDLLAGFGSVNVGHNHPRLLARLKRLLDEEPLHFAHVGPSPQVADLAERLAAVSGLDVALLSSSGAEAVEAALKLARAATGRSGFVHCSGGFHGTSLGTLSLMGEARMRRPFEPLLAGSVSVPFGELGPLRDALATRRAAAFVVEPIQAEGGVRLPADGYLREAQDLCRRFGTLLVVDEVQTGLGRTGTLFASEAEGVVPDVLVLAKALSGGIAPIGATLTRRGIHRKAYGTTQRFDLHSSTFAGNALSCVAALETLDVCEGEGLVARSAARGRRLLEGLRARLHGHPLVRAVRGRGLLVGVELGPTDAGVLNRAAPFVVKTMARSVFGQWAALRMLEEGFVVQPSAHCWNVIRLEPPLTIGEADVDLAVCALGEVLDGYRGLWPLARDVSRRLREQRRRRYEFPA
jgi:putrescine aminotransferase